MDDETADDVQAAQAARQVTDARQLTDDQQPPQETNHDSNSIFSQLRPNHQTTTSLLLNVEAAITNLAGQAQRAVCLLVA